ncbi:MAG: hypothetical protein HUK20_07010 [Fibrobacter sp.]|nr:hypothetical protein [Fibrobacter sp.]
MTTVQAETFVAVIETFSNALNGDEKQFIADKIRESASNTLPFRSYSIMTRENIYQMLPPGKSIEECEGSCLIETGKNISADYICGSRVTKVGTKMALTAELYSTRNSNLIKAINIRGNDLDDLIDNLEKKAHELFTPLTSSKGKTDIQSNPANQSTRKTESKKTRKIKIINVDGTIWMASNIKVKRNSHCYDDDPKNCQIYGGLYTQKSAKTICPNGFRLPTISEFQKAINSGNRKWYKSFLLGGYRSHFMYEKIGREGSYWTSNIDPNYDDYGVFFKYNGEVWKSSSFYESSLRSVRCVLASSTF